MQYFAPIGRRSSEFTQGKKERKKTTAKQKSFRKLSFSGGLITSSLETRYATELAFCAIVYGGSNASHYKLTHYSRPSPCFTADVLLLFLVRETLPHD